MEREFYREIADELTDKQLAVVDELPATGREIADALGTKPNVVRARIHAIRETYGYGAIVEDDGVYALGSGDRPETVTTGMKASHTRAMREVKNALDGEWREIMRDVPRLRAKPHTRPSHEDVVGHFTDSHFGDYMTATEPGTGHKVVTYSSDIAEERVRIRAQRALNLASIQSEVCDFDTFHYLIGGDEVTGTGDIYPGQAHELDAPFREQISRASRSHLEAILSIVDSGLFNHVQVVMVPGNHGEIRTPGSDQADNGDELAYDAIELGLDMAGVDNVNVIRAEGDQAIFSLRGGKHKAVLVHGQNDPSHASTNAQRAKWHARLTVDPTTGETAKLAYAGHYHTYKKEDLHGRQIRWSGSPQPPGDFAQKVGKWSWPCATLHGVSDKFPVTWEYPVYFYDED